MEKTNSLSKQLELNSLIEFSQLINSNLDLKFILGNILLSIMGKMMISKGIVLIKKDTETDNHIFCIESIKGIKIEENEKELEIQFPKGAFFEAEEITDEKGVNFFRKNNVQYFFKVYFGKKLLGLLCLGKKVTPHIGLTKSEIIFIETLLNLSSSPIENTIKFNEINRLNDSLSTKLTQLKSMFELSKEFNTNFRERDKILKLLGFTLLGNLGIRDFAIFTRYRSDNFYLLYSNKVLDLTEIDLSYFNEIKNPSLLSNLSKNNLFEFLISKNYELLVPTISNNEVQNIICLGTRLKKAPYRQSDIEYLQSIINLSVISIENALLFQEYLEKQQIENELRIAKDIQVALLPKEIPDIKGYDIAALNISALHVGGDYYDIIPITDTKTAIVIADVSGKGTPAALLMSNIQSAVHSFLKLYDDKTFDLSMITLKINELIYENTSPEKFITFFWGLLDNSDNTFTYINAGHNHPVFFNNNEVKLLDKGGLMIGIMNFGIKYETGTVNFEKEDVLVLFTDGVTEAQDSDKREFGEDNLIELIKGNSEKTCDTIINEIKNAVEGFAVNCKQFDDITLIAIKKT
ncbi:MAG TPA: PP2C family protein-serine/threonine phosphatase [Ignavibacteria bacterium]|nr:PP2C family protein-serine/threonine phosphatase [Ignavibacteria bacterium]